MEKGSRKERGGAPPQLKACFSLWKAPRPGVGTPAYGPLINHRHRHIAQTKRRTGFRKAELFWMPKGFGKDQLYNMFRCYYRVSPLFSAGNRQK